MKFSKLEQYEYDWDIEVVHNRLLSNVKDLL